MVLASENRGEWDVGSADADADADGGWAAKRVGDGALHEGAVRATGRRRLGWQVCGSVGGGRRGGRHGGRRGGRVAECRTREGGDVPLP